MSKNLFNSLILLVFILLSLFIQPQNVSAVDCNVVEPKGIIREDAQSIKVVIAGVDTVDSSGTHYRYRLATNGARQVYAPTSNYPTAAADGSVSITFNKNAVDPVFFTPGKKYLHLDRNENFYCGNVQYQVGALTTQCQPIIQPTQPQENDPITISMQAAPVGNYNVCVDYTKKGEITINADGSANSIIIPAFTYSSHTHHGVTYEDKSPIGNANCNPATATFLSCSVGFDVIPAAGKSPQNPSPLPSGTLPSPSTTTPAGSPATAGGVPCDNTPDNPGIGTAIGCIHTSPAGFVKDFMNFIIGISGGFAFLMMLLGAFQMLTSAGNPDTLNAGKERMTSAVIGLLFVIFAVLLLQIIGVGILKLPEFTPPK